MKELLDAIEGEIREEEAEIIKEAERFAGGKIEEMRRRAEEDNAKLFEIQKKNITREMRKREEEIRERHLLELVKARKKLVDEVWERVRRRFLSMPEREGEYREYIMMVLKSVKTEEYEVFTRKTHTRFIPGANPEAIIGGVIFRSKDGKVEIDCSLEGVLRENEENTKARIAEVLFG